MLDFQLPTTMNGGFSQLSSYQTREIYQLDTTAPGPDPRFGPWLPRRIWGVVWVLPGIATWTPVERRGVAAVRLWD